MPAYNAELTIERTIRSVLAQTYPAFELVIVDDGSQDGTRAIAERFARNDARVRVLVKPNEGVARARNFGIQAARGELIAPVDADDLWHPTKLEKQVAALLAGSEDTAFVYARFRTIDADDHVLRSAPAYDLRGSVLSRHVLVNFVGNGSSMLLRRAVAIELGGFDATLQERGSQGCEDLLLQLRIASRYKVELVPEYLVGYRRWHGSMSSDMERMGRSYQLAFELLRRECPHVPEAAFGWGIAPFTVDQALGALRRGRPVQSLRLWVQALGRDAPGALVHLATRLVEELRALRDPARGWPGTLSSADSRRGRRCFHDYSPTEGSVPWPRSKLHARRLARLAAIDEPFPCAAPTRAPTRYAAAHT